MLTTSNYWSHLLCEPATMSFDNFNIEGNMNTTNIPFAVKRGSKLP